MWKSAKSITAKWSRLSTLAVLWRSLEKEGFCHISELSHDRVANVSDVVKEGQMLEVKVFDINYRGQIKLSHKAMLPVPQR